MLKMRGIEEVIVFCRDNGAVMTAWAKDQGIDQKTSIIKFMSDTSGAVTKALGMEIYAKGPISNLGPGRTKRFAMYIVDGMIKAHHVSEDACGQKECDPAGDDFPESSCVDSMLASIDQVKSEL